MQKIAIIIPTFNELGNIESLIQEILNNLPESTIFIVDDSKTKEIGNLIRSKNLRAKYFHRENSKGRGSAVLFGINKAPINILFSAPTIMGQFSSACEQVIMAAKFELGLKGASYFLENATIAGASSENNR